MKQNDFLSIRLQIAVQCDSKYFEWRADEHDKTARVASAIARTIGAFYKRVLLNSKYKIKGKNNLIRERVEVIDENLSIIRTLNYEITEENQPLSLNNSSVERSFVKVMSLVEKYSAVEKAQNDRGLLIWKRPVSKNELENLAIEIYEKIRPLLSRVDLDRNIELTFFGNTKIRLHGIPNTSHPLLTEDEVSGNAEIVRIDEEAGRQLVSLQFDHISGKTHTVIYALENREKLFEYFKFRQQFYCVIRGLKTVTSKNLHWEIVSVGEQVTSSPSLL